MKIVRVVSSLDTAFLSLCRVLNIAGMVVLVFMMLLTVTDVFLRYVFNHPIQGGTEITEVMMVPLALGMGWCVLKDKTIKMGLIVDRLAPRVQNIITCITYFIGFSALVFITWRIFLESARVEKLNGMTAILKIPTYPFYGLLGFCFAILTLAIFVTVTRNLVQAVKR
jgi:TRAP-type C4-dicarboxylate transport system permease small subunit